MQQHEHWSNRFAFLMASIGAAVGLGNIWKFPYTLGSSGGSGFLIVYLFAVILIAAPIMVAEMVIGREGKQSAPNSMRVLAERYRATRLWAWVGWMGLLGSFIVLSFYSVIAGWAMDYIFKSASGALEGLTPGGSAAVFDHVLSSPVEMAIWHFLFMASTVFIVGRGIKSGIEKAVNWMMPALFMMLVGLVIYAAIEGDFAAAVDYLFTPDFSKITPGVALAAVGQAFFSLSVGFGMILTYASYLPEDVSLPRSTFIIAAGDTLVAVLAGLAMFPIIFAHGLDPAAGPGLLFVTMSTAFGQMAGGTFVATAFFVLIFVAALTSSIAILETMTARAEESAGLPRPRAAALVGGGAFILGLATVFSFNVWQDVRPLGFLEAFETKSIFDVLDYSVTNVLLPLGGMLFSIFAGWVMSRDSTVKELGLGDGFAYKAWLFLARIVAPVAVGIVFIANLR
jgi:NSS family neurotransmitter:Na+ symporter